MYHNNYKNIEGQFMKQHAWKSKLVLLWVLLTVNFTALLLLEAANGIFKLPANDSTAQYVIALFYFVPCLMAWVSLVSKPSTSRWPNVVIGLLFFILKLAGAVGALPGPNPTPGAAINESIATILAALIIWYGWKVPTQDDETYT